MKQFPGILMHDDVWYRLEQTIKVVCWCLRVCNVMYHIKPIPLTVLALETTVSKPVIAALLASTSTWPRVVRNPLIWSNKSPSSVCIKTVAKSKKWCNGTCYSLKKCQGQKKNSLVSLYYWEPLNITLNLWVIPFVISKYACIYLWCYSTEINLQTLFLVNPCRSILSCVH